MHLRHYLSVFTFKPPDGSQVLSKKLVVNLEQPCASMCTNFSGTLLAVVGRKGNTGVFVCPTGFTEISSS